MIEFLTELSEEKQYKAQQNIAAQLMRMNIIVETVIKTFYEYVKSDKSWSKVIEDIEFVETWSAVWKWAEDSKKKRNWMSEAHHCIISDWTENECVIKLINTVNTYNLLLIIWKCAHTMTFEDIVLKVNQVIFECIINWQCKVSTSIVAMADNFRKTAKNQFKEILISTAALKQHNLHINEKRLLKRESVTESILRDFKNNDLTVKLKILEFIILNMLNSTQPQLSSEQNFIFIISSDSSVLSDSLISSSPLSSEQHITFIISSVLSVLLPSQDSFKQYAVSITLSSAESAEFILSEFTMLNMLNSISSSLTFFKQAAASINLSITKSATFTVSEFTVLSMRSQISPLSNDDSEKSSDLTTAAKDEKTTWKLWKHSKPISVSKICSISTRTRKWFLKKHCNLITVLKNDDDDTESAKSALKCWKSNAEKRCNCNSNVLKIWKDNVKSKQKYFIDKILNLLKKYNSYNKLCFYHSLWLASHLSLQTCILKKHSLQEWLCYVHEFSNEINELKTADDMHIWFCKTDWSAHSSDLLECYKFTYILLSLFIYCSENLAYLFNVILWEDFERDGSAMISKIFNWWWTQFVKKNDKKLCVVNIINIEFNMYQHHLQKIEGWENYEWLRNMMYSICQQLMQQNSIYYLVYCFLCSDYHWWLIFYPYYAKYAALSDKTYFWHINVNISSLLTNNCRDNMIQRSVSLNEKNDSNCIKILLKMQCHLSAWWKWVKTRRKETDRLIHNILKDLYTKENK